MAARVSATFVPAGQFEANPLLSAPELVERARHRFDLDEDAAALYLQTLTLAAPTTKAIQRFNGWAPARLKKALAALVARDLLVEAKRPRAGRGAFLPGGWEALKAPLPPIESWKLPLYGATKHPERGLVLPLRQFLAQKPVHQLFEEAWRRLEAGDAPGYEEVGR
jgi:hypothetical protein